MANLYDWQKITRVLPGKPFGDGKDGAYSSATIPTLVYKSCSGSADSTTLTASTSSPFAVGDILLLHQTRGTGAGQWEINRVSAVGSGSYTMQKALKYTYTDSGASQAQAIKIPRYTNVTVQSGTWTITDWNGDTGGILAFASNGTVTVTGTISADGKGFVLGYGATPPPNTGETGVQGESSVNVGDVSTSANGNGGGGGSDTVTGGSHSGAGGGGGGNGGAGSNGTTGSYSGTAGSGGEADGSADLSDFVLGGGGGGGGGYDSISGGHGGNGGGGIFIFAKIITVEGAISADGATGSGANNMGGGGGGAGGSCLIVCQSGTLGNTLIGATGGSGGDGGTYGGDGGAGGTGRIAVHHSSTVTGTTSPTFTDVTDTSLVESAGGVFFHNYL